MKIQTTNRGDIYIMDSEQKIEVVFNINDLNPEQFSEIVKAVRARKIKSIVNEHR